MATRRERVVLELEDRFTTGMAKAAAQAALLNKELDSLSRDSVRTRRAIGDVDTPIAGLGRSASRSSVDIDRLSGRMMLLAKVGATLGPSLIPIGAVAVPALTGLASQLGFATIAAGTAVTAFQGVGEALDAVNKAAIEPTADNINAATQAMADLSPEARNLVGQLHDMIPELKELRDTAAAGLFPGLSEGLSALETALPKVDRILGRVAEEMGDIARETGVSFASERWAPFLDFLAEEAPSALADLADSVGNTAHALAGLWMAFDPLNDDFASWLLDATASFDSWANSLSETEGFQEFIDYIRTNGPQVGETLSAVGDALLQIAEAASPLGGPALRVIEAIAESVAAIADSDIGTPLFTALSAMSALSLATSSFSRLSKTTFAQALTGQVTLSGAIDKSTRKMSKFGGVTRGTIGRSAALMGGLALATTDVADGFALSDTAAYALMGTLGGPWGIALGSAIGLASDLARANNDVEDAIKQATRAAESGSRAEINLARARLIRQAADLSSGDGLGDNVKRIGAFLGGADQDLLRAAEALNQAERELAGGPAKGVGALLTQNLGKPVQQIAADMDGAERATRQFIGTLDVFMGRLSKRGSIRAYEQSLDDLTRSVKENGKSLDIDTQKGRDNQEALDAIAETALRAAEELEGVRRQTFLRDARKSFIEAATEQLGLSKKAAEELATELGLIDRTVVKPKIDVETKPAKDKATGLDRWMDGLFGDGKTVEVFTDDKKSRAGARQLDKWMDDLFGPGKSVRVDAKTDPAKKKALNLVEFINGLTGTVKVKTQNPRQGDIGDLLSPRGFHDGGYTGNVDARQPAGVVHGREFVFDAVSTERAGVENLYALQRSLRGYATGGYVAPAVGPVLDYDRLARAMSAARPLYGDVHMSGDYSRFKQELEHDRQLAALGGGG